MTRRCLDDTARQAVAITLPDGATRRYPGPVSGADVAGDIDPRQGAAGRLVSRRRPAPPPAWKDGAHPEMKNGGPI